MALSFAARAAPRLPGPGGRRTSTWQSPPRSRPGALRRPARGLDAELPGVFGDEALPAEPHRLAADDASDRLAREEPLEDVEADVPARGAPRDEAAIDVVPEREARAAAERLELPPEVA